jgi:hypothetical protein
MTVYGEEPQSSVDEVSGHGPGQQQWQKRCLDLFDAYYQMLTLIYASGQKDDYVHYVESLVGPQ